MHPIRHALPYLALAFAACASSPPRVEWEDSELDLESPAIDFVVPSGLESGLAKRRRPGPIRVGQHVLLASAIGGQGEQTIRFVRIRVLRVPDSSRKSLELEVRVHDHNGEVESTDRVLVTEHLADGCVAACEAALARANEPKTAASGQAARRAQGFGSNGPIARGVFSLMDVLRVVNKTPTLRKLMWRVVQKPSLLSMIGGVRVSAGMSFRAALECRDPISAESAYAFPLRLFVNGRAGLVCTVRCVDPSFPLRPCGGIVELIGRDPVSRERRLVIRVIGAGE